jgi:hypothetical protein
VALGTIGFQFHPHYAAPFAPALSGVFAIGALTAARGRPFVGRLGPLIAIAMLLVPLGRRAFTHPAEDPGRTRGRDWAWARQQQLERLQDMPGKHLVLVRYGTRHNPHREWVHNGADLENAKVVWARELPDTTEQMLEHFSDRTHWLVTPDRWPPTVRPLEDD